MSRRDPDEMSFKMFEFIKRARPDLIVPGTTQLDHDKMVKNVADILIERGAPEGTNLPPFVLDEESDVGQFIAQAYHDRRVVQVRVSSDHTEQGFEVAPMAAYVSDIERSDLRIPGDGAITHLYLNYTDADLDCLDRVGCLYRKTRTVRLERCTERVADFLRRPENFVNDPHDPIEVQLKAKTDPEIALAVFGSDSPALTGLVTYLCQGSVNMDTALGWNDD